MSYTGYFLDTPYLVIDGNIVYAKDINNPLAAIKTGLSDLVSDIQTGAKVATAVDTGVVNAYKVDLVAVPVALADGLTVWIKPTITNTGASTINVNDFGVKSIRGISRSALIGGELVAGFWFQLKYSSGLDVWILVSDPGQTNYDYEILQWESSLPYSWPDLKAGSDGYSYRCISLTPVTGVDPTTDDGTTWVNQSPPLPLDKLIAHGNAGTSITIDCELYDTHTFTCDQATLVIAFTNMVIGRSVSLHITGADNCTITWPITTKWHYGVYPTFTSGADKIIVQRVATAEYWAAVGGQNWSAVA